MLHIWFWQKPPNFWDVMCKLQNHVADTLKNLINIKLWWRIWLHIYAIGSPMLLFFLSSKMNWMPWMLLTQIVYYATKTFNMNIKLSSSNWRHLKTPGKRKLFTVSCSSVYKYGLSGQVRRLAVIKPISG